MKSIQCKKLSFFKFHSFCISYLARICILRNMCVYVKNFHAMRDFYNGFVWYFTLDAHPSGNINNLSNRIWKIFVNRNLGKKKH